jgi:hypothetical protein
MIEFLSIDTPAPATALVENPDASPSGQCHVPPVSGNRQGSIPPPPDPVPGQNPDGCLYIVADVATGGWTYCGKPVHLGNWCAAHYVLCRRWRGMERRRRALVEALRDIAAGDSDDRA